jgi:ribose 5-phosphate isomerase B
MKVYLASDHAGYELKNMLVSFVHELGHEVEDLGAHELNTADDYPLLITPCAEKLASEPGTMGIILGSSGQGEAMVANRIHGIRAAVFYGPVHTRGPVDVEGSEPEDEYEIVRVARAHNDANVLSLGARFIGDDDAKGAVQVFLSTAFSGSERHARRIGEF